MNGYRYSINEHKDSVTPNHVLGPWPCDLWARTISPDQTLAISSCELWCCNCSLQDTMNRSSYFSTSPLLAVPARLLPQAEKGWRTLELELPACGAVLMDEAVILQLCMWKCGWAKVKMRLPVDWPCLEGQLFTLSHLLYLQFYTIKLLNFLDSDNQCDLNSSVMEFVAVGGWPMASGQWTTSIWTSLPWSQVSLAEGHWRPRSLVRQGIFFLTQLPFS